jgi:hypothetical protein
MIECSSFVTTKKIYNVYLKFYNNSKFEILGDEEDYLICPYIWNSFQKFIKGQEG